MYKNKILFLFIFAFVFFTFTSVRPVLASATAPITDAQCATLSSGATCVGVSSGISNCPTGTSIKDYCQPTATSPFRNCCTAPVVAATPTTPASGLKYTLLEKIPGLASTDGSDLPKYILALYNVALVIVVLSAVFMVSIGGFMYLTSAGNTSAMGTAKGIIFDALIGLVIALTAWLLLNVINPDLTTVSINGLSAITVPGGGPVPPPSPGAVPTGTTVDLAKQISGLGVLQGSGECSSPSGAVSPKSDIQNVIDGKGMSFCSSTCKSQGSNGCVGSVSPNETMLKAIITVKSTLGYTITSIAGGAHAADSAHYTGNALDIAPSTQALLDAFVTNGAKPDIGTKGGTFCESKDSKWVVCSSGLGDHVHVKF